ncbi:Phosphatidylglycerol/phosphatidylinositol transfer protein [Actinomortierella ambigua]|nr:Phosphatidylglycerol/phosphatidylinositol transfer protein [Actinomortierella ambigua]
MRLSLVALALALAATATQAFDLTSPFLYDDPPEKPDSITICGNSTDTLAIKYIRISPDPPKKGEVLRIDAKGVLSNKIDQGSKIQVLVKTGVVKLVQQTFDFCEESSKINKECPVQEGEQDLKHEVTLPKEIPPVIVTAHVVVIDQDGRQVTCLNAKVDFRPRIPHFN